MSEVCQNCEGYYDTVYRVPDGVWERLTGHTDGAGLLCPACCELLARRAGLELYWEATVGEYPVAAERERCCRDSCRGCAEGVPLEFTERPGGGVTGCPPGWVHWWGLSVWTVCGAAGIRERARAGE